MQRRVEVGQRGRGPLVRDPVARDAGRFVAGEEGRLAWVDDHAADAARQRAQDVDLGRHALAAAGGADDDAVGVGEARVERVDD